MIHYNEFSTEHLPRVMELYASEGWDLYTDSNKVKRAFERSIYVLGAFCDETLIGFIRCTGDGEYDVYVSDLLVDNNFRRAGVGRSLLQAAMQRYSDADTFALMTGLEEDGNNAFYRSLGLREYHQNRLVGYLRP